jgi:hypothetical protein
MNQDEKIITLNVNFLQLNTIMSGLDELPHKISRPVFDFISNQAKPQIQIAQNFENLTPYN